MTESIVFKTCTRCKATKPITEFYPRKKADGITIYCKECFLLYSKESRNKRKNFNKMPPQDVESNRFRANRKLYSRLFSQVQVSIEKFYNSTPCWEWTGYLNPDGYARIYYHYHSYMVHNLSYQLFVNTISNNLVCDHLCRNKSCCNPCHLEAVTNAENVLRGVGVMAINARKTHCHRGHPLSGVNLRVTTNTKGKTARICLMCRQQQSKDSWQRILQQRQL